MERHECRKGGREEEREEARKGGTEGDKERRGGGRKEKRQERRKEEGMERVKHTQTLTHSFYHIQTLAQNGP